MKPPTEKKLRDLEKRLVVAKGRGRDGELGVSRCKPLPLDWISHGGCCIALGTMSTWEDHVRKRMCVCVCVCV